MYSAAEAIAVISIVCVAACYAVWSLLPAPRRLKVLMALDKQSEGRYWLSGFRHRVLEPLLRRAVKRSGSCSDCSPRKLG